jgi:signal transduction histidine kinase
MRSTDSPYLADLFAITLRWLAVIGMATCLALAGEFTLPEGIILLLLVLWNCYASMLAILNRRMASHRPANVIVDGLAALGLFAASGGVSGPLTWSILPLALSSSVYFAWNGALLAVGVATVLQAVLTQFSTPWPANIIPVLIIAAGNLLLTLLFTAIASGLLNRMREKYTLQTDARKELEVRLRRQEHERMQALYTLMTTLSATLNYQVVLDTALDLSVKALNDESGTADRMVSAVMLFSNDKLQVGSARRFTPSDMRVKLPGKSGVVAQALNSGEPAYCDAPAADDELERIIALRACQGAFCLPLISGLNVYGILLFAHPDGEYFTPERREVLEIIGHQAVLAIQNARLYQDLALEKERIVEAQEEARKKLARDLHDGPTQSVAAIAMRVNYVRHLMDKDPSTSANELARIEDLAFRTNKEIRHMLFTLRPLTLESEGLAAALRAMADKMRETFNQNVLLEIDPGVVQALEIGKQTVVFYIVEEALNNARKHANARHVWVRLRPVPQEKDLALLEVVDDGVGFNVQEVTGSYESRGSLGMVNLRERSELISAILQIDSVPGQGTRVQVFIPLSETAAERLNRVH